MDTPTTPTEQTQPQDQQAPAAPTEDVQGSDDQTSSEFVQQVSTANVQEVLENLSTIPHTIDEFLRSRGVVEAPVYPEPFGSWVRTIRIYSDEMRPNKPATSQVIAKNQRALYTMILSILNNPTHIAVQGMDLLMFWISKNTNTLFAPDYVLRGAGLRMDKRETILFQEMITLFIASYDLGSRQLVLKQFSLDRILAALPTPIAQENFAHYYGS